MLSLFFFNDTATTEIYTLSLHDALPISPRRRLERRASLRLQHAGRRGRLCRSRAVAPSRHRDRKSTRLNSSHLVISYAVFCLKKKKYREYAQECRLLVFSRRVDGCSSSS